MNKRLISLLLVLVLICTLLPMTVLAEGQSTGTVKVMVYGKAISDAVFSETTNLSNLGEMLKKSIQDMLGGETLPDCNIVLVAADGTEYALTEGAAELDSPFYIQNESMFANILDDIEEQFGDVPLVGSGVKIAVNSIRNGLGGLTNGVIQLVGSLITKTGVTEMLEDYFVTYSGDKIPVGTYTLKVKSIDGNGYKLWEPASGTVEQVQVSADKTVYVGFEKVFSAAQIIKDSSSLGNIYNTIDNSLGTINKLVKTDFQMPDFKVVFPGIWLKREEPGFKFIKTDLADKPLNGADFLMIDRNETLKIVSAMFELGKDTFTNAVKLIGTEGFTWQELNFLRSDLLMRDDESNTITINPEEAQKLVNTYWALVEKSASEPFASFLDKDLRIPALLKATSGENGENGIVEFTPDSNITLVWSINILLDMANLSNEMIQSATVPDDAFENEQLKSIVEVFLKVAKLASPGSTSVLTNGAEAVKSFINEWIYPILQNDNIPQKLNQVMKILDPKAEEADLSWSKFIPNHAILTEKMPAGEYIMAEEHAPDGYMRNPVFYTIHLTWDTTKDDVRDWCYVTVADLGIIGPYLAENYYTFLRNNSFVGAADRFMSATTGQETDILEKILTDKDYDVTKASLEFWGKLIYNIMGGSEAYDSEKALDNDLAKYLLAHGRNMQSLWQFAYQVANRSKAVISSKVDENWHFYNFNDSIHSSLATVFVALLEGTKDSIKEDTIVGNVTKSVISSQINAIQTIDNSITQATKAYTEAVKTATANAAKSITNTVTQVAKKAVTSLLSRLFK